MIIQNFTNFFSNIKTILTSIKKPSLVFLIVVMVFLFSFQKASAAISDTPTYRIETNGYIYAITYNGNHAYIGGYFTTVGGESRNNLAEIDLTTGLVTSWNPGVSSAGYSQVNSLAISGSTIYVGGLFETAGGQSRNNLAEISLSTGLATAWNPNVTGSVGTAVNSLVISNTTLYIGGYFSAAGGQSRNNLAEISLSTGLATAWNPNVNLEVKTLALSSSTIYIGGSFTSVGGQTRNRLAEINLNSGLVTSWNPDSNGQINSISLSSSYLFAVGYADTIGGQYFYPVAIAKISLADASIASWDTQPSSYANVVASNSSTVYLGGSIIFFIGQSYTVTLGAVNLTTGEKIEWLPFSESSTEPFISEEVYALQVDNDGNIYAGKGPLFLYYANATPSAPESLSATVEAGQSTLSWTAPSYIGNSALTQYMVKYKAHNAGSYTTFGTTTPATTSMVVTGLTNGTEYDFQVIASNTQGDSDPASASATPVDVPTAPLSVVAVRGLNSALVSFNQPVSNGGSVITSYTVTSSPGGFSAIASSSPIIVSGLTNGIGYTFTVIATNIVGNSPSSTPSNIVVPSYDSSSPNWYNSSWAKRKTIAIAGSTVGAQSNYQIKISVPYVANMKSDFSDLRFTDSEGQTLISHWLESKTNSVEAIVWVKVPLVPAHPDTATIYMYYGNPSASSNSSGVDTFDFFDTFGSGGTSGDWNYNFDTVGEHAIIYNGKLYAPLEDHGATRGGLAILDPADGRTIKHFNLGITGIEASPAIDNSGYIHVYSNTGVLKKIDENTGVIDTLSFSGAVDWEKIPYDTITDYILTMRVGTGLVAVKASDYSSVWTNSNVQLTTNNNEIGPPLIVGAYTYFQDFYGNLFKIRMSDGQTIASSTAPGIGHAIGVYAQPIYDSITNRIYVTNGDGHTVYAINASDMSTAWSKSIEGSGWKFFRGGAYHNNVYYANIREASSPYRSKLYALNTQSNGDILWVNNTIFDNGGQASSVLVDDEYVYQSTGDYIDGNYNNLVVLNVSDGSLVSEIPLIHGVASSIPTVYNGKIIIGLWVNYGYQAVQVRTGGSTANFPYKGDNNMTGYVGGFATGPLTIRTACDYSILNSSIWTTSGFNTITNCAGVSTVNTSTFTNYITGSSFSRANTAIRMRAKNTDSNSSGWDLYAGLTATVGSANPVSFGQYNGNATVIYDQGGSPQTVTGTAYVSETFNISEVKMNYPSLQFDWNDVNLLNKADWSTSYNNVPLKIGNNRGRTVIDWVFSRKYVYPEPTVSSGIESVFSPPASVGSGFSYSAIDPSFFQNQNNIITPPQPTPTTPVETSSSQTKLIKEGQTYYLVINGQRKGITNPGILYSYGFEFKDAVTASELDKNLPQIENLLPGDGALVKSPTNSTVYLISQGKKYGFVSGQVFTAQGFSFKSVLVVTSPELDKMPLGPIISDPNAVHLPGVRIVEGSTIYFIGYAGKKHPYPSLDIYNSWNLDNNFSIVVKGNTADSLLPAGEMVSARIIK
jgi:hypothetical protein